MDATNLPKVTLILGGARSGKSALAEKLAHKRAGDYAVLYAATLLAADAEMKARVVEHRASRPASWHTVEVPYELADPLKAALGEARLVLLDCLTVWTGNLLIRESSPDTALPGVIYDDDLLSQALPAAGSAPLEPDRELTITSDLQTVVTPQPQKPPAIHQPDYARLEAAWTAEVEGLVADLRQRGLGLIIVSNEVGMGLVPPYPIGRLYRDMLGRLNARLAALADEVFMVFAGLPVELKRLQAELS